ncbi:MAG: hypothetical protein P4L40_21475 [Terracidiphilus sp.]|nr:hypothetical protein [Terracidiphilus sp.]
MCVWLRMPVRLCVHVYVGVCVCMWTRVYAVCVCIFSAALRGCLFVFYVCGAALLCFIPHHIAALCARTCMMCACRRRF